jgi:hypothetical protein
MAEKSLVYRINFDGLEAQAAAIGKVDNELTNLNQTIKKNRADLVNYTELNMQNTQAYADLTEELGQNIVQQRNLTKAKGDLIRETQNEAKVLKENEGSIVSLRAQLSNLTKEYNNLTKAERESAKGKDVQNQAKAISDELKKLESAVGNTSRNVGNYKEALAELETSLKQLLQAQAAARKSGQENNAVFVANEAAIAALAQEYQVLAQSEKEVDNQLKALTASENEAGASAESLKSKLRALKEAAAVAGEGTEDFQRLTAEAAKLQDAVDDANEAIKQEKGTEFEKFREQLGGVGQSLGNLDFKQANERIAQLGGTLKGLTFSSLKDGLKGAGSSFTAFGRVLLANPIFLIAAIAAAVGIALFALKDKVKIIGQAFELATLGPRLLIQAFKDLGDAIGVTSFAADEAAEKTAKALKKEAEAVRTNTDFYANQLDRKIALLKAAGQDTTEEELKRLRELEAGAKKERDIQEQQIQNKQKQINAGRVLSEEEQQQFEDEKKRLDELSEAYANASNDILVFYATKKKAAADDAEADAKKAADDAKKAADDAKRKRDEIEAANKQLLKLQQENDLALIDNEFDRERQRLEIQNKANLESVDLLEISEKLKQPIRDAFNEQFRISIEQLNDEIKKQELDAQFELNQLKIEGEKIYISDRFALGQIELQQLIDKQKRELEIFEGSEAQKKVLLQQQLNERNALIKENDDAQANAQKEKDESDAARRQKKTDEDKVKADEEKQKQIEQVQEIQNVIASVGQSLDILSQARTQKIEDEAQREIDAIKKLPIAEEEKEKRILAVETKAAQDKAQIEKKNADRQKVFAVTQALISGALAIVQSLANTTLPFPLSLAGPISIGIATAAQIAAISAQKFAEGGEIPTDGGFITGNSHANGGVKFSAGGRLMEAEGGEIIVNKGIQKRPDFVRAISQMNYMTGGKKFETGGIVAPVFSAAGASLAASEQNLGSGFTFEIPPIQVLNNVVDTTSQQSSIIQIQNQTSIGG